MTNEEKWLSYTSGLASPDKYIQWGWYYTVAAALQRRVWCPPDHRRLYPNMYVTFVGKAAVGKGNVIRCISDILGMHTLDSYKKKVTDAVQGFQVTVSATETLDLADAKKQNKDESAEPIPLFHVAADAVTYEALIQSMSRSVRRTNFINEKGEQRIYSHCSECFVLEEIASLFKDSKQSKSLVNFLIQAYDCGDSYTYKTKTQGTDRILRLCLNFIGGTTPDFMQETFDDRLLNQGYSSRTFYIYAAKNRKSVMFIPELTAEQKQHRLEIGEHIKSLYGLHGQVHIDQADKDWLQTWWEKFEANPALRTSKAPQMEAYYGRKQIHVMKLAMAHHFGESMDMHIPRSEFEWAIDFSNKEEKTMHLALMIDKKNPLAEPSRKIVDFLKTNGRKHIKELQAQFWGQVDTKQLSEVITFLLETDVLTTENGTDPDTNKTYLYYILRSKESDVP